MDRTVESRIEKTGKQISQATDDLANAATDKAQEMADEVGHRFESTTEGLQEKLRQTGKDVSEVVSAVSNKVKSSANYLQEHGFAGIVDDVEVLIRRYPIHALLLGIGLGFLLSRGRSR